MSRAEQSSSSPSSVVLPPEHPDVLLYSSCDLSAHLCSLEDLVAGAWEVQDHMDRLADAADNPRGLERGLATMSAVADQRTRLQVSLAD